MRNIHPGLLDCLRRPNPYTELITEISAPDTSDVLRRPDQFTDPANLLSQTPAGSLSTSSRGPLQLASASTSLAAFTGETTGLFNLHREDPNKRLKGVGWTLDKDFVRAVLRTVTAKIYRGVIYPSGVDFELQVYRVTRTPGLRYKPNATTGTPWNVYSFTPLLSPAPIRKWADLVWVGGKAELSYDLTSHGLVIENTPEQAVSPDQTGELPKYYFVVRPVNMKQTEGEYFGWLVDTVTARTIAGLGTFKKTYWARNSGDDTQQWQEDTYEECPYISVTVEQFQAASEAVYALDLTKAPAAGTTGRVMFERLLPPGTAASLALSTAGAAGPWTAVKHGDVVATAQQTYHLKLNLAADTAFRSSPGVTALGVEFRKIYDVSAESVVEFPTREIALPWLEASIAEAKLKVLRLGIRDYLDVATTIGSTESPAKLEVDIYLASRHPAITRDKWLRIERLLVETRTPSANAEEFRLLSYGSKLKRKIPEQKETISSVHTVAAGSTAAAVLVTADLPGVSDTGNEYDNKRYYMRVQTSAANEFSDGHVQEIAGNTGRRQLDFNPALPAAPVAGDVIEVHSGIYATQAVTWQDADFADIWWQLLTTYIGIPPERIGIGSLPRGGKPPTVTDRAPGDVAAQAKLKGTFRMSEQESGDEALDQVSFHMGGATVEIDGQICFIQIYPLRAPNGAVTVPLPPVTRVFDGRDYSGLAAVPGLEKRATVLSAKYGKNAAAANPDAYPEKTTVVIDNDAFTWLARTDLEDLGTSELPEKIHRWLYNSSDTGLQLATEDAGMVVRSTSTGLRVWPFSVGDAQPEITLGDVVVVITDQYTDYDPASGVALKGWLAVRGVVVRTGGMGRSLAIFVPGLTDNVMQVKDGTGDELSLGDAPEKPTVTVAFNADGQPTINIDGRGLTASLKFDVDKVATPADGDVEATTAIEGAGTSATVLSRTWAPGETLYGKAFAYAGSGGTGQRSEAAVFSVPRESGLLPGDAADIGGWIDLDVARGAGLGRALVDAALRRGGVGGTYTRQATFSTYGQYGRDGARLLFNPDLERVTADLDGPTGIGMDVVERGGNKGDQALDASNIAVAAAVDFTRAYTGKNLANVPDDATSDRRAATANEKTGGSRGFSVIDTGLLIVAAGIDFVRSYTNKHLGNLPDDATSDRRAATLNQKTGGDRGAAAIDAGNVVVAAGVDLSRGYTNKHLGNIPDDATSDRKAVTTDEKTGAGRGYTGLDSSAKLVTGVTSAATAADGLTGITSKRSAVRAAGSGSTAPAHARRRGEGGTVSSGFQTQPVYSADGSQPLVNPLTDEILNARIASSSNFENPGGTLGSGVQQTVAGTARTLQRGYQSGFTTDGATGGVSFSPAYQGTPVVMFRIVKGRTHVGAASSSDQRLTLRADNLDTDGFDPYFKIEVPGAATAQNAQFTSPLTASNIGDAVGAATLSAAPAADNTYRARFKLTVGCTTTPEFPSGSTKATVAVDVSANAGSTWTERGTIERTVSRTTSGTTSTTFTPLEVDVSETSLDSTDKIRLRLKNIETTGADTIGTATVEGFDNSPTSEGHGVTYNTETGATPYSVTPNTGDSVKWESWEAA